MNKLYISLSIFAAALNNSASAQATITTASLPQVGYTYNMQADTIVSELTSYTVSAGSATAQTWDFSAGFDTSYLSPVSFVAPGSNPGATSFPNSNLASDQGGGNWAYFISGASGLYIDGAEVSTQGVTVDLDFMPNAPQLPTPFTYGNTTTVTYTATGNTIYITYQVVVNHAATRTITADAFGTVVTPAGTFTNVLRVKTYEITADSIYLAGNNFINQNDTTTNYSWYQNLPNALVMSIDQNTGGATTKAQYLETFSSAINAIKHSNLVSNLFPNPANTVTYLTYENTASSKVNASIFNVTGQQVATLLNNQQQAAGKQTLAIDVNNLQLAQGLYLIKLSVNGEVKTLKLNVQ